MQLALEYAAMHSLFPLALLVWLPALAAFPSSGAKGLEDAVYVYHVFRGTDDCQEVVARLRKLPLRPTVILSVERGREFVLDRPNGEQQLACVLEYLRASSRSVKALLLQAPSFLEKRKEAVRRTKLLGAFAARHPGKLAGVQIDVEPHEGEQWREGDTAHRRARLRSLHELLCSVRPHLRGLPLGIAAPWWYPSVAEELPEAAPAALFAVVDEIYLMTYGGKKEPRVGGTADRVLARVDRPEVFSGPGRVYLVLATYEYRSQAHLQPFDDLDQPFDQDRQRGWVAYTAQVADADLLHVQVRVFSSCQQGQQPFRRRHQGQLVGSPAALHVAGA